MSNIREKVENFLKKYGIFDKGKTVLIAFSGGYDSLCLLDVLHKIGLNLTAIHLNHNWRGEESLKDCLRCKEICNERNILFYSENLPENIPHNETAARKARYEFFERCAKKFGTDIIFTAHNANDNAETVLYRIIKGTGTEGLAAIQEKRGIYYRPLLSIQRDDIEKYCGKNNLNPNIDSSNNDTKYNRNFIRHEIIPQLLRINKDAINAINSLSDIISRDTKILNEYTLKTAEQIKNSTQEFINLPPEMQNRIIYTMVKENNNDYDSKTVYSIVNFINDNKTSKSGKKMSFNKDLWVFANKNTFELINGKPKSSTEIQINCEGEYDFDEWVFKLKKSANIPKKFPDDCEYRAFASFENIDFTLRYRKDGDIINPLGTNGSQKLKKYLNAKGIPNHKKNFIPVLCSGNEVLWVAGCGISEKIKVENTPVYMLELVSKEKGGYGN